ncbi:hypothetical protein ACHAXR_010097, partial [Thalassiosira sp. AJA248-18]
GQQQQFQQQQGVGQQNQQLQQSEHSTGTNIRGGGNIDGTGTGSGNDDGGPLLQEFPFFFDGFAAWVCRHCQHIPPYYRGGNYVWQASAPPPNQFVDMHLRFCPGLVGGGDGVGGAAGTVCGGGEAGNNNEGLTSQQQQQLQQMQQQRQQLQQQQQQMQQLGQQQQQSFSGMQGGGGMHNMTEDATTSSGGGSSFSYPMQQQQAQNPFMLQQQQQQLQHQQMQQMLQSAATASSSQQSSYGGPQDKLSGASSSGGGAPDPPGITSPVPPGTKGEGGINTPPIMSDIGQSLIDRAEDPDLLTDYFFHMMQQLVVCRFSEKDRKTRGGKRENISLGYGGLQCIHCIEAPSARKFFWSTVDRLANSFAEIPSHVLKCKHCPDNVKDALLALKGRHPDQMQMLPRGSQKVFFRRMWRRLHDGDRDAAEAAASAAAATSTATTAAALKSPKLAAPDAANLLAKSIMEPEDSSTHQQQQQLFQHQRQQQRVVLAIPEDKDWLSDLDCFIRNNIEVYSSKKIDVENASADRKYPITIGQVGIRCVHCAKTANGARGAGVSYPYSISGIYESVREFQRLHLDTCQNIPPDIKDVSNKLGKSGAASLSSVLRRYYVQAARALGLYDTQEGGIRAGGKPVPMSTAGFQTPSAPVSSSSFRTPVAKEPPGSLPLAESVDPEAPSPPINAEDPAMIVDFPSKPRKSIGDVIVDFPPKPRSEIKRDPPETGRKRKAAPSPPINADEKEEGGTKEEEEQQPDTKRRKQQEDAPGKEAATPTTAVPKEAPGKEEDTTPGKEDTRIGREESPSKDDDRR